MTQAGVIERRLGSVGELTPERCPRCGCDKQLDVSEFLHGRDWGVLYYCGTIYWPSRDEITREGVACRQLAQAKEQLQQALAREAELRRVVEAAERLMIALDIAMDAEDADDTFVAALDDIAAQEIIELRAALSSAPAAPPAAQERPERVFGEEGRES